MSRALSSDEIDKLTHRRKKDAPPKKVETWPSDQDRLLIYQAALACQETVKLSNGNFSIKFRNENDFFVKYTDEFVGPCGWFGLDSLKVRIDKWV